MLLYFHSQIQVNPNYNGSSCDTINSQSINQPNSLGISLTSTIGNKCNGGKKLGLIIGLAVGIPLFVIILVVSIISIMKYNQKKRMETLRNDLKVKNNPQNTFEDKFVENKGFDNKGQRTWTTNESNIANQWRP